DRAFAHAVIGLALRILRTGSAPAIQAEVSMTQTFWQLIERASVRSRRSASVTVDHIQIITSDAITEPRLAVRVVNARSRKLRATLLRDIGRAFCAGLLAAAAHPEKNEPTNKAAGHRCSSAHRMDPFPCTTSEPRSRPQRSPTYHGCLGFGQSWFG